MRFPHKADRVTHYKLVAPINLDKMNYTNNVAIPVGFRFHPTDEELVGFYLHGRVTAPPPEPREEDLRIIRELDLYKHEPWDLSEVCKIPGDHSVNQNNWYFFSHKDKKYPTGNRANRATKAGFWKATGRDKCIQARYSVGMRKTLVFYKGRAPHGQKTDWIMHEFRLDDGNQQAIRGYDEAGAWVVCRVFRKTKNLKSKGDHDTPSTSMEEDQQMALLPEITDSTEKFSSDGGEDGGDVDYPPADHMVQQHHHFPSYNMHCKQELNLSVNDYSHMSHVPSMHTHDVHHHQHGIEAMLPSASTFRSPMRSDHYITALFSDAPADFDQQPLMQMGAPVGASSSGASTSAAGMFSPLPEHAYLGMPEPELHQRPDIRNMSYRNGFGMFEGLVNDDVRFGNPMLDQSLTDVVSRPLDQRLQQLQQLQQLQHSSELLSSLSSHEMVPFGLPWDASAAAAAAARSGNQFVDFQELFCRLGNELAIRLLAVP